MSIPNLELPALYDSADKGSSSAQRWFLRTIKLEYFLLFSVSVVSDTREWTGVTPPIITLFLVILAGLFVFKIVKKMDQDWYRCRALAESVKTSTWRFAMRAHPFDDTESIEIPKANFRNLLRDILRANQHIAESLESPDSEQVTSSMIEVRNLALKDRVLLYVSDRIDDQRTWYSKKSAVNRKAMRRWIVFTVLMYVIAAVFLNAEEFGVMGISIAFGPQIVLVTSALGWLQMKRHGELVASYNLTAHEIGIIRGKSGTIESEENFSDFVNEAELAFSREHTQWVARRDAK